MFQINILKEMIKEETFSEIVNKIRNFCDGIFFTLNLTLFRDQMALLSNKQILSFFILCPDGERIMFLNT